MIIYDAEIEKAIESKSHRRQEGIEYCEGWKDFEGMGLTVVCAYDYVTDRYRVFMEDNLHDFAELIGAADLLVGFNSIPFDNQLLRAQGLFVDDGRCYDLLREIWIGAGLAPEFEYPSHIGYGLDDVCKANFGVSKTGHGALAPVDWQRGRYGSVTDYCLADVALTKKLLDKVIRSGWLISPKTGESIKIRRP